MKRKSILIVGSLSDIAKSVANKFAEHNYDLLLTARNLENLKLQANDLKSKYNVNVDYYKLDILNIDDHQKLISNLSVIPDIVLCAVGFMGDQKDSENKQISRSEVIRTNFEGPVHLMSEFANLFEKRESGTIIGISSVAGIRGKKSNYIYGSAKSGLTTFLSGLRNRLYEKNVNVITVLPGTVYTKMTLNLKLPKLISSYPDKIAQDIFNGVKSEKNVVYTLAIWKYIMKIINLIPESIFKKTNL